MSHMAHALSLAKRALGSVSPNPPVGAVVVKDGEVVGEGYTQPPGGPHAERVALEQAGPLAAGAVLYTTLEPCSHHGRTPPCTDAIVAAGIVEVRAAMRDPNPAVSGGGVEVLRERGLRASVGELSEEANKVVEAYVKFVTTGRPMVTAKFATSLDGKIATRTGDSQWITGDVAREHVHLLRATRDAIMVGANTVLADDPRLTARDGDIRLERQPLRVVVDSHGVTPTDAAMMKEPGKTLVAVADATSETAERLRSAGAEVVFLPSSDSRVDLEALVQALGERDVTSVMVEGGGSLLGALFDARLVDKVMAFVAPTIIGGREAPTGVMGEGVARLADAFLLENVTIDQVGRDVAVVGYVPRP